jgi:hypothetical protein
MDMTVSMMEIFKAIIYGGCSSNGTDRSGGIVYMWGDTAKMGVSMLQIWRSD